MSTATPSLVKPKPVAPRQRAADPKVYGRSKLSNDVAKLLPDVDGRMLIARRYRDIVSAILVNQAVNQSVRRAANS